MTKLDARGLSCPEPVIMIRNAMKDAAETLFEIMTDNEAAKENVTRFAENHGADVETVGRDGGYLLRIARR